MLTVQLASSTSKFHVVLLFEPPSPFGRERLSSVCVKKRVRQTKSNKGEEFINGMREEMNEWIPRDKRVSLSAREGVLLSLAMLFIAMTWKIRVLLRPLLSEFLALAFLNAAM